LLKGADERGSETNSVAIGASSVNVNSGALEVL
jgi:hypothetical protein